MAQQIIYVAGIVLPLYLVIATGAAGRGVGIIDDRVREGISRLVYYVATPPLLFLGLAKEDFMSDFNGRVIVAAALLTIAAATIVYQIGKRLRMKPENLGTFTQGAFRSNMVFYGLPVCIMAYGDGIIAPTAIFLAAMLPVYNCASVIVLAAPHANQGGSSFDFVKMGKELLVNPIIIGCAAGIIWAWLKLPLPVPAEKTCQMIGGLAMPLALIELGSGIKLNLLRGLAGQASANALIKLFIIPIATYLLLRLLGPLDVQAKVAVIMMATPTAMMSYIMARQMKGSETLAAQQLILSTLLSILTIPAWLLFIGI